MCAPLCQCVREDVSACAYLLSACTGKMREGVWKYEKTYRRRAGEVRADGDGIWGEPLISWGRGGIKNRQAFWWDVIWFLIDTRPSLIGLRCQRDGSQAQLSLDQMYADMSPTSSMTFLKMKAQCRRDLSCWTERETTEGLQKSTYQPDSTWHCLFSMTNCYFIKRCQEGIQPDQPCTIIINIRFIFDLSIIVSLKSMLLLGDREVIVRFVFFAHWQTQLLHSIKCFRTTQ